MRNVKFFYCLIAACFLFLIFSSSAHAIYTYKPMEKIPGFESAATDFPTYLLSIVKFAIWTVGIAALLMIIIGGFMYITSAGNTSRMDSAKRVIFDALYGLIVALAAWLLLYVINPDLAKVNISLKAVTVTAPAVPSIPPAPPVTPGETYANAEAVAKLSAAGISVISTGNCSDRNNSSCTSLEGIPKSTIDNLINLKRGSGCDFDVTGGTEVGHASHGSGRSVVDISENSCLVNSLDADSRSSYNITKICTTSQYQNLSYNCGNYVEGESCFHLVFST